MAFELGLKGCKAIYGLNINIPASREQLQSDELPRMEIKTQCSAVFCAHRPRVLVKEEIVLHYLLLCVKGIKNA